MITETRVFDLRLALPKAPGCPRCIGHLSAAIEARPGVEAVSLSPRGDKLVVRFDASALAPADLEEAVRAAGEAVTQRYRHERLTITEMDCPECARTVEQAVAQLPGVSSASLDFALGALDLAYDVEAIPREQILRRIRELGYGVAEEQPSTLRFRLEGMDCAECAAGLEGVVAAVPGVLSAQVDFANARLMATVEGVGLEQEIARAVARAGYTARLETEMARGPARRDIFSFILSQRRGRRMLAAAALLVAAFVLDALPLPALVPILFYGGAIVIGGYDMARGAWASLRTTRNVDMNVLMTIAVVGAALIGEWTEAAVIVLLFAVGNTLEAFTLDRARDAVRSLIDLSPQEATLIHEDHEERVRVEALRPGDRVRVRPGERIPADGEVIEGQSAVDEAPITGEAAPADKEVGSRVYAGTVNGYGALVLRVTQSLADSALARMVRLVEQAQAQKAPSQRFVDRFARIYTPLVVAGAVAIAVIVPLVTGTAPFPWIYRALTLLVISCPCALVISTPVAIVSALGRAARHGVLIKGGSYLEAVAQVRAVAFDKTRTLTLGRPVVTDILSLNGAAEAEVLTLAAALERNSEHPLAQAVVREARHRGSNPAPAQDFQALPGRGARGRVDAVTYTIGNRALLEEGLSLAPAEEARLEALEQEGKTVFLLARCGKAEEAFPQELLGAIAVADRLRPESRETVAALRKGGIAHTAMLTGDNAATANAIAREAGIDEVRADLLPDDKVAAVEDLSRLYGPVAMVGDGINDAPALARATVGIAMGAAGTDAALETADIALMGDDLSKVSATLHLARQALAVIRQNIGLSLAIKGAFVILATLGIATLWMAVFADMGTSLIVTLNGMRLARE
ncbi:MAG: heavy metal translocating P-type ATPase [Anaerolineae bacterium]